MFLDSTTTIERRVQHPNSKVEDGQWPDTSDPKAYPPHGAIVGLPTSHQYDQKDRHRKWPTEGQREVGHHDEGWATVLGH